MIWIKKGCLNLLRNKSKSQEKTVCDSLGIPSYLQRNGRPEDNNFLSETIYRRFRSSANIQSWLNDQSISSSIFPVQDDSCNRSKYSNVPEDVLYNVRVEDSGAHYLSWGILEFDSDALKTFSSEVNGEKRYFTIGLIHSPLECMYPHSEIIVYENGERIDTNKPKSIKRLIRDCLINNSRIVKHPD